MKSCDGCGYLADGINKKGFLHICIGYGDGKVRPVGKPKRRRPKWCPLDKGIAISINGTCYGCDNLHVFMEGKDWIAHFCKNHHIYGDVILNPDYRPPSCPKINR
jgi:hypothetical protein